MRIVFMGTPDFSVVSLKALIDNGYDVVGVVTQPDKPKGRGNKLQASPVKLFAQQHGIPVLQPKRIRKDGLEDFKALSPDLCVTAAFGQILSEEVLAVPTIGTVNVHASLLPKHRGAAPANWSILQGETMTGVTTMLTDKGIDTGDILLQSPIPISDDDTAGTLLEKLSHEGADLLIETIQSIEKGCCPRIKQNEEESTYDPMLTKEMGVLYFNDNAQSILLRVRAMSPWPCAYIPIGQAAIKVWSAKPAEGTGRPGEILTADPRNGLIIATKDGAVELIEIQVPGAKRMDAKAFLRGHSIPAGILINEVQL